MTQEENNQSNPEYETFYNINGSVFSTNKWHRRKKDCGGKTKTKRDLKEIITKCSG